MSEKEQVSVPSARPVLEAARAWVGQALAFHRREAAALAMLGLLVLAGAGTAYMRARPASAAALAPVAVPAAEPSAPAGPVATLIVHVAGAVARPGVYEFAAGARVVDAVEAAGGFSRKADRAAVNLARPLVDGEQILVPRIGEAPPAAASGGAGGAAAGGKLNINLATAAELEELPGIGPVLAQRIVDHREQHGSFRSVNDLMKVSGIGPKTFASLEPLITV